MEWIWICFLYSLVWVSTASGMLLHTKLGLATTPGHGGEKWWWIPWDRVRKKSPTKQRFITIYLLYGNPQWHRFLSYMKHIIRMGWNKQHKQPDRIHGTGIFTYIYCKNQLNVGKYTSPMDPMGTKQIKVIGYLLVSPKHHSVRHLCMPGTLG